MIDYIKREDAQDIIARKLSDYITDEERWILEYVDGEIGDILSAEVREIVRGKWIIHKVTTECSNCHTKWNNYRGLISTFYFCPDCGADMRGEENDS